jgi:hypothetical protein
MNKTISNIVNKSLLHKVALHLHWIVPSIFFIVGLGCRGCQPLGMFIIIAILMPVYLAPSWIAWKKNHKQQDAIVILNIFGGWLIIGWIVAIVWAFTDQKSDS